jgi:hypothetical protein
MAKSFDRAWALISTKELGTNQRDGVNRVTRFLEEV